MKCVKPANSLIIIISLVVLGGCSSQETTTTTSTTTSTTTTTTISQKLKWSYVTEAIYWSSPAIDDDGTIYIGTGRSLYPSKYTDGLYAIKSDGTLKWKFETGHDLSIKGAPVIGSDGTIYCIVLAGGGGSSTQGTASHLYAIKPDGTLKWKYENLSQDEISLFGEWTPAISSQEVIYTPAAGAFYAINSDSTLKWKYTAIRIGINFSSPAIGTSETIYTNVEDNGICAFNPDGTLKWVYPATDLAAYSSPTVGSNETIYAGRGAYLYALNPDGTLKWKFYTGGLTVMASPSIGSDETIYIGTTAKGGAAKEGQCGIFYAINADGTEKWKYDTSVDFTDTESAQGDIYSSAAIGADGTIYFSNESRYLYAFNPDGTLKEKYDLFAISPISSGSSTIAYPSPAIAADGTIYVGDYYHYYNPETSSQEGAVYALISSSEGLANTPWPKIHNNNKNTGRKL